MSKYIFLTGKGGVGKTSISSALAYKLSKENKKVLLVSTDPAHSLSDIFETEIGPNEKQITENLYCIEIEPKSILESSLASIVEPMKEFYKNLLPELSTELENDVESSLYEMLESPGSQEVATFEYFHEIVKTKKEFDYIIFDTAPTGHTLKFLKLPEIIEKQLSLNIKIKQRSNRMLELVKKLFPFMEMSKEEENELLKYQQEELLKLTEKLTDLRKLRELLQDIDRTKFLIVSNPDGLSFFETKKLINELENINIPVKYIIINKILPDEVKDPYLEQWKKIQKEWVEKFKKEFNNKELLFIELLPVEVRGIDALELLAQKIKINI